MVWPPNEKRAAKLCVWNAMLCSKLCPRRNRWKHYPCSARSTPWRPRYIYWYIYIYLYYTFTSMYERVTPNRYSVNYARVRDVWWVSSRFRLTIWGAYVWTETAPYPMVYWLKSEVSLKSWRTVPSYSNSPSSRLSPSWSPDLALASSSARK